MGIIRAAINSVKGGLADSWQEVIQPRPMSGTIAMVPGEKITHGHISKHKGHTKHRIKRFGYSGI